MNTVTIIFFIICILIGLSILVFEIIKQNILLRHVGFVTAFFLSGAKDSKGKIPEEDWKLFKKYRRVSFICFLVGVALIFLLIGLDELFNIWG